MIDEKKYETVPVENDNFPLRLRRYSEAAKFHMHWHGHVELLYFLKGGASVCCGGEEMLVEDGELIVVNENELHRGDFRNTGVRYLCIMIPPRFFEFIGDNTRYVFGRRMKDRKIHEMMSNIFLTFEEKEIGYRYKTIAMTYELISYLIEKNSVICMDKIEYEQRNSRLANFNNIIDYIEKNYPQKLRTPDIAASAHLSEYYFCHLFKKYMGVSFTTYLNNVRIKKAAAFLDNTKLNVTEVAAKVGFDDVNYFSRVFKNKFGVSPKNYRAL